jgi:hypothetical protein
MCIGRLAHLSGMFNSQSNTQISIDENSGRRMHLLSLFFLSLTESLDGQQRPIKEAQVSFEKELQQYLQQHSLMDTSSNSSLMNVISKCLYQNIFVKTKTLLNVGKILTGLFTVANNNKQKKNQCMCRNVLLLLLKMSHLTNIVRHEKEVEKEVSSSSSSSSSSLSIVSLIMIILNKNNLVDGNIMKENEEYIDQLATLINTFIKRNHQLMMNDQKKKKVLGLDMELSQVFMNVLYGLKRNVLYCKGYTKIDYLLRNGVSKSF